MNQPQPVAYYCDHRTPGSPPHQSIELPEGEGYQVQDRPEVYTSLTFADQQHYPEHLRGFHCPAAVPLYRPDEQRNQVLTEAAKLITTASLAKLDETDEDDRRPSDWERHEQWLAAASILRKLPKALCALPHPIAPDTRCALLAMHDGWHEDESGDRWPNVQFPLVARTAPQEQEAGR